MRTYKKIPAPLFASLLVVSAAGVGAAGATTVHQPSSTAAAHATKKAPPKVVKVAFRGVYKGTIALEWSAAGGKATAVNGTGTGTYLGASKLVGLSGSAPASNTCDPMTGTGYLLGGGSKLMLTIITNSSQACAAGQSAPTSVSVKGLAKVTSGIGKWKGATGNLKFTGSFSIKDTTAGSKETDTFSATLTGVLVIRK